MYIIAATNVDLDVILLILGIVMVAAVGILLIMLLVKLNRTVSKVNTILNNKQKDIQKTISNLPEMTENISDAASKISDIAGSVSNITGKAEAMVSAVSPMNMFGKIPGVFKYARKAFGDAFKNFSSKHGQDSSDDDEYEDIDYEEVDLTDE